MRNVSTWPGSTVPAASSGSALDRGLPGILGVSVSRNLTPHDSGLKDWSDAEIERAIREGGRKDDTKLKPPIPYRAYQRIDKRDMKALIAYLRSLPPKPFGGVAEPTPKQ